MDAAVGVEPSGEAFDEPSLEGESLLGALPGRLGLGTVSPRLDRHGNSVRGVAICERLSRDMGMPVDAGEATSAAAWSSKRCAA